VVLLLSLWVYGVLYSGEFLTKTTASQEVDEGGVMIFFEKNKVLDLGVEPNRVLNILEGI
jgi:hypothetical protein